MADDRRTQIARNSLLLKSFTEQQTDMLLSMSHWHSYQRNQTLFQQDEKARSIHIVVDGWVKLYRITPNGGEAIVSVFTKGQSFGEAVALRGTPYPVSAEAVTDTEVLQIPAAAVTEMVRRDPEAGVVMLAATFTHLHALVAQLEQLKAQTGAQRVAEFLLELCEREEGSCLVTLPYDKVVIAGRLGIKPESLSRAFSKLKEFGVKVSRNNAAIEDIQRLRDFSESDPAAFWNKRP
ncbi:Crp/Fnr family transcriptional regulator [Fluviibacterium sp. DFM31]|uniref:Crp/Fnr family transcriptional regulator n=1 Tax=Meridianimarinicoccus marinus TaxID=3231483 RepID=A0ABV3L7M2_9RHOB